MIRARILLVIALVVSAIGSHASTAIARERGDEPPLPSRTVCPTCEKRTTIPFVRTALVQTGMYVAAGALWPEAYSPFLGKRNLRQFKESWSDPPEYNFDANILASDGDWWTFNLLLHGLFGSEMYLAARDWGHRPVVAFLYALLGSTVWEYLIEGWTKQPSAVDLVWTPGFGSLFGELRYRAVRATYRIRNRALSRTLRILVDPLGEMERTVMDCRHR